MLHYRREDKAITMRIFVPRFFDEANHNAQNLNAKAIMAHAGAVPEMQFHGVCYDDPVILPRNVRLTRLWRRSLFKLHMILLYQGNYDAIFYPGKDSFDRIGLLLRKLTGRRIPVIATFEGMAGDEAREQELGQLAGHEVFCNRMASEQLRNFDFIRHTADHVIAISSFLAKIGRHLYGDKFSVIPLGVNTDTFYSATDSPKSERLAVVCAGTVYPLKRPELFLALAEAIPNADFKWYGGGRGDLLDQLETEQKKRGITNLEFTGGVSPEVLAEAFRKADLFVLPSKSEGVPKVSQEAAACGLPLVMFGYYEAHSLEHGKNGLVAWNDDEFISHVESLIQNPEQLAEMGAKSAAMATAWDWDRIAPQWLTQVKSITQT